MICKIEVNSERKQVARKCMLGHCSLPREMPSKAVFLPHCALHMIWDERVLKNLLSQVTAGGANVGFVFPFDVELHHKGQTNVPRARMRQRWKMTGFVEIQFIAFYATR